jgi:PBP1b-binding outer membrane lipoprotein LpoB
MIVNSLSNKKKGLMKKLSYLLAVIFVLGMLLASCNRKVCPAYSHNDNTEQSENPAS